MKRQESFTLKHYSELLRELKKSNYQFIGFTQAEQSLAKNEPFVLLRHDIDLDISATLLMAHLESEEGIRSNYFFLVRSDIYNIFSDESSKVLRELMSLGHTVSVHFDCAIYPALSQTNLEKHVLTEVKLFEAWYDTKVEVISFHRPGNVELSGNIDLSPIRHPYEQIFFKKIAYFSDSRGMWRYGHPLESEAFIKGESLQLLIHPIWWNSVTEDVVSRLDRMIEDRTRFLSELVESNVTPYRERNI